jgi:hypothetical protein
MPDSIIEIIAESSNNHSNNLSVELIKEIGLEDSIEIINLSKELNQLFGKNAIINKNNIKKYFNRSTYPFIARLNNKIIGFIIGAPLEVFTNESWSHYDTNLGKNNTIYTYMFLMKSSYRKKLGYSKILKMIYINWCKKNNYTFVTGHVRSGISNNFSNNTKVVKIFPKWYDSRLPFEYYRRPLK